jgi:hypothetical protein
MPLGFDMTSLAIGKNYCLRLPDGRSLGHVRIERTEDGWAEGPWTPAADFAPYRELFERETQLRHDQVIPLWEQAADAIEALGIEVLEVGDNTPLRGLRVAVENGDAIVGPVPEGIEVLGS